MFLVLSVGIHMGARAEDRLDCDERDSGRDFYKSLCKCTPKKIPEPVPPEERKFDLSKSKIAIADYILAKPPHGDQTKLDQDALELYRVLMEDVERSHSGVPPSDPGIFSVGLGRHLFRNLGWWGLEGTLFTFKDSEEEKIKRCDAYVSDLRDSRIKYAVDRILKLNTDPVCVKDCTIKLEGVSATKPLLIPDPEIPTGYRIARLLKMPDGSTPPGATEPEKLRNFLVALFERNVRIILGGSEQLQKNDQPNVPRIKPDIRIHGITEGYITDVRQAVTDSSGNIIAPIERMFSTEFAKEASSCIPEQRSIFGFAIQNNHRYKIFRDGPDGTFAQYAIPGKGVKNHMCVEPHQIDRKHYSGAIQRGNMVLAMWKVYLEIRRLMLDGKLPDPSDFGQGLVDPPACRAIKDRIIAARVVLKSHLERLQNKTTYGTAAQANPAIRQMELECSEATENATAFQETVDGKQVSVQRGNVSAACYVDANRQIVESQWVLHRAECVWRSVAFEVFDHYMTEMVK